MSKMNKTSLGIAISGMLIVLMFIASETYAAVAITKKSFPQHSIYQSGTIKPNHISQQEMDNKVADFYNEWKKAYLKQTNHVDDQYYIFYTKRKSCGDLFHKAHNIITNRIMHSLSTDDNVTVTQN